MRTKTLRIGDSHAVLIPEALLKECGLSGIVEITARNGVITVAPPGNPREGWAKAFMPQSLEGDDTMIDVDQPMESTFDAQEWEW
jgi:antitoxin component of MazEF toxin-antitoxin module